MGRFITEMARQIVVSLFDATGNMFCHGQRQDFSAIAWIYSIRQESIGRGTSSVWGRMSGNGCRHFARSKSCLRFLPARMKGGFYQKLAVYGHVGRMDIGLPWEVTDKAALLQEHKGYI